LPTNTRLSPTPVPLTNDFNQKNPERSGPADPKKMHPTTPHTQRLPSLTRTWFSLIPVRSPLLRESLLFTLPTGTEMFYISASTTTDLYILQTASQHYSIYIYHIRH